MSLSAGVSAGASIPTNGDSGFFSNLGDLFEGTLKGFSEAFVSGAKDTAPLWTASLLGQDLSDWIEKPTFQPTPQTRPGNVPNTAGQNSQQSSDIGLIGLIAIFGLGYMLLSKGK